MFFMEQNILSEKKRKKWRDYVMSNKNPYIFLMNATRNFTFHAASTESVIVYKSLCECYFDDLPNRLEQERALFLLLHRYSFVESALPCLLWYSTASCINFRIEH